MKDFKAIVAAYKNVDFNQRKAALATVVKVRGSSYRSPGARMLITDDGRWVGSISGGCTEGDALRKARQVMADKKPVTVTYDTREESNQNLGIGLGCNGVIDVLIEPLDANDSQAIQQFAAFAETQTPTALATIFNGLGAGEKLLLTENGEARNTFQSIELTELVKPDLQKIFTSRKSQANKYLVHGIEQEVFIELIQPSISVIIFGGVLMRDR